MTRALLVLGITLAAALPARADFTHRLSSSVQLDGGVVLQPVQFALATATASAAQESYISHRRWLTTAMRLVGLVQQLTASMRLQSQTQVKPR